MSEKILKINLEEFEGKTIYDIKFKILTEIRRIKIQYSVPTIDKKERFVYIQPFREMDLAGDANHQIITKIELEKYEG